MANDIEEKAAKYEICIFVYKRECKRTHLRVYMLHKCVYTCMNVRGIFNLIPVNNLTSIPLLYTCICICVYKIYIISICIV